MSFDPISAAFDLGGKVLDHFLPDPAKRAEAQMELEKMRTGALLASMQQQVDINKVEAANPNMFVAGWRPFVGWICGLGLGVQFLIRPIFMWGANLAGHPADFPTLDMGTLMTLLAGMLGLTAARTVEKMNDVQGNH